MTTRYYYKILFLFNNGIIDNLSIIPLFIINDKIAFNNGIIDYLSIIPLFIINDKIAFKKSHKFLSRNT